MEAVNDGMKLIAQAIEVLKGLDHEEESEVICLLISAVDILATCST